MADIDEVTERLEEVFYTYAEMEKFTTEEMADRGYMADKFEIWYECGFISQNEYHLMQANWGEEGREA